MLLYNVQGENFQGKEPLQDDEYDGLNVSGEDWPPLLRPDVLADAASYAAWERHMVRRCVDPRLSPESVVGTLERDARTVRAVRPVTGESIANAIRGLPANGVAADSPATLETSLAHLAEVMAAVPEEWRPDPDTIGLETVYCRDVRPRWNDWHAPLKRYLAAKAFASWTAYQGRGFLSIVRGLDAALALVRVEAARQCRDSGRPLDAALLKEAFRQADFALNHLAAGDELAERWSKVEA
jgi:hypothetical protein